MNFTQRVLDLAKREAEAENEQERRRLEQQRQQLSVDQLAEQRANHAALLLRQRAIEAQLPAITAEYEKKKDDLERFRADRFNPLVGEATQIAMALMSTEIRIEGLERQAAAQEKYVASLLVAASGGMLTLSTVGVG